MACSAIGQGNAAKLAAVHGIALMISLVSNGVCAARAAYPGPTPGRVAQPAQFDNRYLRLVRGDISYQGWPPRHKDCARLPCNGLLQNPHGRCGTHSRMPQEAHGRCGTHSHHINGRVGNFNPYPKEKSQWQR